MDSMYGLTLHQPWATLISDGRKAYETRSWKTAYRGLLLIHAGKRKPLARDLQRFGYEKQDLVLGAVICIATLADCILMDDSFISSISSDEYQAGHWETGRYAWHLIDVRPLETPIEYAGNRRLWSPSVELRNILAEQEVI